MTPDQRDELKQRKLILKAEIRLKKLRERIADQLNYLEEQKYEYTVHYEGENLIWLESSGYVRKKDGYNGIHGDFQLDVDDTSQKITSIYRENEFQSAHFTEEFTSILPDTTSLIVCSQGGAPEFEISLEAFLSNPSKFMATPETWIISMDKSWIIQYLWDQPVIRMINLTGKKPFLVKKLMIQD